MIPVEFIGGPADGERRRWPSTPPTIAMPILRQEPWGELELDFPTLSRSALYSRTERKRGGRLIYEYVRP